MPVRESGYQILNDHLNTIALRLATHLEETGYPSLFFPTTNTGVPEEYAHVPAMFSQRHAAVRAGLGEFGLNNVVVTAKYGPRIRWNSVITAAPSTPSPLLAAKTCDGLAGPEVRAAMPRRRPQHAPRGRRRRPLAESAGADRLEHVSAKPPDHGLYGSLPARVPGRQAAGSTAKMAGQSA